MGTKIFTESITPALLDNQKNMMLNYIALKREYKREKLYQSKLRTGNIKVKSDLKIVSYIIL
jgi:hypothetical protein